MLYLYPEQLISDFWGEYSHQKDIIHGHMWNYIGTYVFGQKCRQFFIYGLYGRSSFIITLWDMVMMIGTYQD